MLVWVTLTSTPGNAPLVSSVTIPVNCATGACAMAGNARARTIAITATTPRCPFIGSSISVETAAFPGTRATPHPPGLLRNAAPNPPSSVPIEPAIASADRTRYRQCRLEPVLQGELHDPRVAARVRDRAVGQARRSHLEARIRPVHVSNKLKASSAQLDASGVLPKRTRRENARSAFQNAGPVR